MPWIHNLKYGYEDDISTVPGFLIFRCILRPCVVLDLCFDIEVGVQCPAVQCSSVFPDRHQRRVILADLDDSTHFSIHSLTQTTVVATPSFSSKTYPV